MAGLAIRRAEWRRLANGGRVALAGSRGRVAARIGGWPGRWTLEVWADGLTTSTISVLAFNRRTAAAVVADLADELRRVGALLGRPGADWPAILAAHLCTLA